jgi:hypothetical protein
MTGFPYWDVMRGWSKTSYSEPLVLVPTGISPSVHPPAIMRPLVVPLAHRAHKSSPTLPLLRAPAPQRFYFILFLAGCTTNCTSPMLTGRSIPTTPRIMGQCIAPNTPAQAYLRAEQRRQGILTRTAAAPVECLRTTAFGY